MKLAIELEEPYAEELELRAFSSGKTVKEYVEASVKADVEAGMSFDEKTALYKELAGVLLDQVKRRGDRHHRNELELWKR